MTNNIDYCPDAKAIIMNPPYTQKVQLSFFAKLQKVHLKKVFNSWKIYKHSSHILTFKKYILKKYMRRMHINFPGKNALADSVANIR